VTVTVNPKPMLTGTTSATICNGTVFMDTLMSSTPGTTFSWSRASVAGNPAASGGDTINETLINSTANAINVIYIDTLNYNGCINTQSVTVTVNPTPQLSSATSLAWGEGSILS